MQANDQNGQDKVRQNRHPPQTTIIGKSMLFFMPKRNIQISKCCEINWINVLLFD